TVESMIRNFPDSFYLYHILSFIVDLSDVGEIGGEGVKLTGLANNIVGIIKQKGQNNKLLEGTAKLMEGYLKERSGNIIEAQELYKEVAEKYSSNEMLKSMVEIFICMRLLKDNKFKEAENKLEKLQETLTKSENHFFLKNSWSLLGDLYRKQAEQEKENKDKFLKKGLYNYLNVYLFYIPTPEELPEIYAKSLYYGYKILSELSQTAKTEAQKNEYTTKAQSLKNELQQRYANTMWAGKL
ncbi:MAG: hypothetical protein ACK4NF_06570, partial [Planctomycetota bacterium]